MAVARNRFGTRPLGALWEYKLYVKYKWINFLSGNVGFLSDQSCWIEDQPEWSHHSPISWLLICSSAGVRARSQEWLREVFQRLPPLMIIGALAHRGQLSGCTSATTSGGLRPTSHFLSLLFRRLSVSSSTYTSQGQVSVSEEEKRTVCRTSKSAGRKCAYTVSKVIMKCQLWYVTVPRGALITVSF